MDPNQLFKKYKEQPLFQAAAAVWIVVALIKLGMLGFEFGQWLKVH